MTETRIRPAITRRRAILARCPRCKAPVLTGHDDTGLPTHADPTPLTRSAELVLHLAGRAAYEIQRGELVHRNRWRIRTPARGAVVPEHACGAPLPEDCHAERPIGPAADPGDVPPF